MTFYQQMRVEPLKGILVWYRYWFKSIQENNLVPNLEIVGKFILQVVVKINELPLAVRLLCLIVHTPQIYFQKKLCLNGKKSKWRWVKRLMTCETNKTSTSMSAYKLLIIQYWTVYVISWGCVCFSNVKGGYVGYIPKKLGRVLSLPPSPTPFWLQMSTFSVLTTNFTPYHGKRSNIST